MIVQGAESSSKQEAGNSPPLILSLSCVFPNRREPRLGTFVRSRLQALATLTSVQVVAPVSWLERLSSRRAGGEEIPESRTDLGMRIDHPTWFNLPGGGWINDFLLFFSLLLPLRRIRRVYPFNILDGHFGHPDGVATALLAIAFRCPFIVTLRGSELIHSRYPLRRFWMRWALRRAQTVVTVSSRLRDFALELGVQPERLQVIPNGVTASIFRPRDQAACRAKHGISLAEKVILSAGHLSELKGHHRVARALRSLHNDGIPARLLIVGGKGRQLTADSIVVRAIKEAALPDHIRLIDELPPEELAELMCCADVFCLASSREGWPNVVHEALACGTPVVATDVGAIPDLIPSPAFGRIVPPNEPAALAEALKTALLNNWDRDYISSHASARSWASVAEEVLKLALQDRTVAFR